MASSETPTGSSAVLVPERLPTDAEVADMFGTLFGRSVTATPVESVSETAAYALSLHVNADGALIGAVGCDLVFTANVSVAIAGQDPKVADDVVYKGAIGLDLWDNFREVSNVMNVLFTGERYPRVILHSAQKVELPLWSRLQHANVPSVSYSLEIDGYPPANFSIFAVADLADEELHERLMAAGEEAAAHAVRVVEGKLIRPYDFHKPKGVERSQLNALRHNLSSFTKSAAATMTELLQQAVHIKLVQLHHQHWDDYSGSLDNNAFITTFRLDPLPSQFILTFSPGLSVKCLECRLSGGETSSGSLRRSLTDLDVALLNPIVNAVIAELSGSISDFVPVRSKVVRHITEKFMMEGVTLSLTWLVAWMTLRIGGSTFDASLCFPVVPMQPVFEAMVDAAQHGEHHHPVDDRDAPLADLLPDIDVDLSAQFPAVNFPLDDIARLRPGSVIPLGIDHSSSLLLSARGRPLATVDPVVIGHRLCAQILDFIEDPEEFFSDLARR